MTTQSIYEKFFDSLDADQCRTLAYEKRLVTAFYGLPDFRDSLLEKLECQGDVQEVMHLFGQKGSISAWLPILTGVTTPPDDLELPPSVKLWFRYRECLDDVRSAQKQRGDEATSPLFARWRARQIRRCDIELGNLTARSMTYPVIAFELSEGCSIGCWFCGISAKSFMHNANYSEYGREWKEIIDATKRFFGPAASTAFCYWGTDPVDNPDYPLFIEDLSCATGVVPQSTTAAAQRCPNLIRKILKKSKHAVRVGPDRFSILSSNQLRQIFSLFSAEEMLHVDLALQIPGLGIPKAVSGRARLKMDSHPDLIGSTHSTIACVTGYLVNLRQRTIRLITPVRSSEIFPNGFRTIAEEKYDNSSEYESALNNMINQTMSSSEKESFVIKLRDSAHFEYNDYGFTVSLGHRKTVVKGDFAYKLGNFIIEGNRNMNFYRSIFKEDFNSNAKVLETIRELMDNAMILEYDELS